MSLRKKIAGAAFGTLLGASILTSSAYAATTATASKTETAQEARPERKDILSSLVESGKLSESTYNNIKSYMSEHKPEKKEKPADGSTGAVGSDETGTKKQRPARKPDSATTESSTSADGTAAAADAAGKARGKSGRRGGGMMHGNMLQEMLEAGVITQSEYDVIKETMPERPEKPEKKADGTTTS
ncbi:MAG: hypothetical protein J6M58_06710 [Clostridium sp.]|nr:hypothetical protein [Clostridium sp.]